MSDNGVKYHIKVGNLWVGKVQRDGGGLVFSVTLERYYSKSTAYYECDMGRAFKDVLDYLTPFSDNVTILKVVTVVTEESIVIKRTA